MMLRKYERHLVALAAVSLMAPLTGLHAQVAGATLTGKVEDSTGAAIPNASIDILKVSTGVNRHIESNDAGNFTAPNLDTGGYRITVTAPGFGTSVVNGLNLEVGANVTQNFALTVASSDTKVEVQAANPAIELTSSQISNVVNSATMRQLPLNTRDWTLLSTLQPGVSQIRTEKAVAVGADRGNRGYGTQLTIAGGRPQQNNYRMDGISINDYSNGAPGSVNGVNLGVDAIQEFSVVTANGSAEYGREAGGVINAVSRAGTSQFHGTVFEFIRNDIFDARDYFNFNSTPKARLRKNQFGGALGGPIIKDKTFFFANYEGIRQSNGLTSPVTVPSANAHNGILACPPSTAAYIPPACAAGNSTYTVTVAPDTASYFRFFPLPNGAVSGDTGTYTFVSKQITPEDYVQGRLDHKFSEKDSAHATYLYDDGNFTQPDAQGNIFLTSHTRRQLGVLEETHIFSSAFVNTARGGISRNVANITNSLPGPNALANDTSLGGVPGRTASSLVIGGINNFGGGVNSPSQYNFYWTSIQAYDDAFYTVRNHTFKFGGAFERMRNNILATSSPGGLYTFSSVADFTQGRVQNFSAQLPGAAPEKGLRQSLIGGYFLDDWKAASNLTVNVGVRYEPATVPIEVHGYLSTLRNLTDANPHLGSPYFANPTLKDIQPRVGLAWDPFKTGKTAIRAGFGIFDVQPLLYQFELLAALSAPYLLVGNVSYGNSPNGGAQGTQPGDGKFAHGSYGSIATPSALRQAYIQPNPGRSYLMEWNMNIQQDLGHDIVATVGFVGSRGVHQPFRSDDVNTVQPIFNNGSTIIFPNPNPATGPKPTRLNTAVGQIAALYYNNNTYYDGLQAGITKRLSHGLQLQASYTYSKAIDQGSAVLAGDPFGNSVSGLFLFAPQHRRGVADFNVPNQFVFNYLYQVPKFRDLHGFLGGLANGYELTGIYVAQNGLPFTPTIAGDALGLTSTAPYDVPDRDKTSPGCDTAVNPGQPLSYIKTSCFSFPAILADGSRRLGNAGRNSLLGPRIQDLDFTVMKNTSFFSDRFNAQFRAEVYNALNHPSFSPPIGNRTVFTAAGAPVGTAGRIQSTVINNRQIQFGLKLIF